MKLRHARLFLVLVSLGWCLPQASLTNTLRAETAQWIWSPQQQAKEVPQGSCYFRKRFNIGTPVEAKLLVAADDRYELFLNGRRIGSGTGTDTLDEYDISDFVKVGRNLVAIKVTNSSGATAALAAHITVKDQAGGWRVFPSDESWVTSLSPLPFWYTPLYNDSRWASAKTLGEVGKTPPWDTAQQSGRTRALTQASKTSNAEEEPVAGPYPPGAPPDAKPGEPGTADTDHALASQPAPIPAAIAEQAEPSYQVPDGFSVETVLSAEQTGSLIAMAFNEFGHIVASREDSGLLLIYDSDKDGRFDKTRVYCDQVKNCQGILCLNGEVFVSGDGPDGVGVYRLMDNYRDGRLEEVRSLVTFDCQNTEFGPHGIALGPDGCLYAVIGNGARIRDDVAPNSPYRDYYEGDLPQPRYEDPSRDKAAAPGGTVLRMDIDGQNRELVAGGLRNAYDLAFSTTGGLLTADTDAEDDLGSPWYRSSSLFHIVPGGEYGWRSGWAKWPEYYLDRLPAALDLGGGTPTGLVVYEHGIYPAGYRGSLFVGEWNHGQILCVKLAPQGASCKASSEIFVKGDSLNVSDLDVGPDGLLYFTTGGRNTTGGIYRVRWTGFVDPATIDAGQGLAAVIRQPQPNAAWARQNIAVTRAKFGKSWDRIITGVVTNDANPWNYRMRALDLMQLYGPPPDAEVLLPLARAKNELLRGKAAVLMGLSSGETTRQTLIRLLHDSSRSVRRKACEALVRSGQQVPWAELVEMLQSDDRFEATAARRLLERQPVDRWKDELLASDEHRLIVQAGLALMVVQPTTVNAKAIVGRIQEVMQGFVSDQDFMDMLRVLQVAMHRTNMAPEDIPEFCVQLAEEFPAGDTFMNRELIRLLSYLQVTSIKDRYLAHLESPDVPQSEKATVAMHLTLIPSGWTTDDRIKVFDFLQNQAKQEGGGHYHNYLRAASRDFAKTMTMSESMKLLARGAEWPAAALGVLYNMPERLDTSTFLRLKELDAQLADRDDIDAMQLKIGIVAVMSRSGDPASLEQLRRIWRNDPERRQAAALGLAQWPSDANWEYLVRSLPVLDGDAAREVIQKLRSIDRKATDAEDYRQLILCGLRLQDKGAADAIALLEHWSGERQGDGNGGWRSTMAAWQDWYTARWPALPDPSLPAIGENTKWNFDRLFHYLTAGAGRGGDADRGAVVFEQALCAKCHRFGGMGEDDAPGLTSIAQRATKRQVLESILYPSQNIPPSMAWQVVVTKRGRQYSGLVSTDAAGNVTVVQGNGSTIALMEDQVEQIVPLKTSTMPSYLLDGLELQDVADLFAFLRSPPQPHLAERPTESSQE